MPLLINSRTIIDYITLDDAEFFTRLVNSKDWLRYIGDRNVHSIMDAQDYLQAGFLQCYQAQHFGYYLVRKLDRTPIGICGFLNKPQLDNPDFGFAFLPQYTGQGYAHEAGAAVLEYGIKTFDFTELDAVTQFDNLSSIKLLTKLGFVIQNLAQDKNKSQDSNGSSTLALYRWHASLP